MTVAGLALIGAVALAGPLAALWRRWRVPTVMVELAAGLVLGVSLLDWIDPADPVLKFLADEVGFALVMFVAGTHVPLHSSAMRRGLKLGTLRAVLVGVLSVPAGLAVSAAFGTGHTGVYAVLIASSSAAVIMPMLPQGTSDSPSGTALIAQIAIADIACIVALPLTLEPDQALHRLLGMAAVVAAAAVVFAVLTVLKKRGLIDVVHGLSKRRALAIEMRVSLTLLFAVVALGQLGGVSPMFSGFMIGLVVRAVGEPTRLTKQMFAITEGFFGPLFFVWLGASINVAAVVTEPRMLLLGLALGVAAVAAHAAAIPTRQAPAMALIASAQLGVPAAAVAMGTSLGVFVDGEAPAILLGALTTLAVTMIAATRLNAPGTSSDPGRKQLRVTRD